MQEHLAIDMFEDVFQSSTVSGVTRPLVVQYHMQLDPFLVPGAMRYQMLMTMTSRPGRWVVCCQWLHCMRVIFKCSHAARSCRRFEVHQLLHTSAQRLHSGVPCSLAPAGTLMLHQPRRTGTMQRPAVLDSIAARLPE